MRQAAKFTISAAMVIKQCRMGRAGLNWSIADLAAQSGVSSRTIAKFEGGQPVSLETVERLRSALSGGGALFLDVEGRPGVTVRA